MTITSVQIPPYSWGQWLQQSVWWCAPSGYSWRWFCWTRQWRKCLDRPLQGIQCTTTLFQLSCFRNPRNHFLYCHFLSVVTTGGKTPQYLRPVRDQLFVLVPNQTTHNPRNHFLLYWLSCSDTFLLVAAFLIFPSISDLCWRTVLSTVTNLWEINFSVGAKPTHPKLIYYLLSGLALSEVIHVWRSLQQKFSLPSASPGWKRRSDKWTIFISCKRISDIMDLIYIHKVQGAINEKMVCLCPWVS